MGLFRNIFGSKEEKSLEQLAREAVLAAGVKIDPSFNNENYYPFNITGIGETEKDSDGALKRFMGYLKAKSPEIISRIEEGYTPRIGVDGRRQKRINAVGYKRIS